MDAEYFFDRALRQLQLLTSENFLDLQDDIYDQYIFPLCLIKLTKDRIAELSQEDAPQDSLGGKRIALTCKKCNNTCGAEIDCHLINAIENYESSLFIPGTTRNVKIKVKGKEFNGQLTVLEDGQFIMKNSEKQNDYRLLKDYIGQLEVGMEFLSQNKLKKQDIMRASNALLKNAYIILFAKFGYTFLLDSFYDTIRKQIWNFEDELLPRLWSISVQNNIIEDGVYLLCEIKGFLIKYTIKKILSYQILVVIPMPKVTYEEVEIYLKEIGPQKPMKLQKVDDLDYWNNIDSIKKIRNTVYE